MNLQEFYSGAVGTPPAPLASPSVGYPSNGSPGVSEPTIPGAHWFHQLASEHHALLAAAGLTPSASTLNQLLQAMQVLFAANGRPGHTYTDTDWHPLGGGLLLQWVRGSFTNSSDALNSVVTIPLTFSVAFPSGSPPLYAWGVPAVVTSNSDSAEHSYRLTAASAGGATVVAQRMGGTWTSGLDTNAPFVLFALGK